MPSKCMLHEERDAEARCTVCRRPMCSECTITTDTGKFCGTTCKEKYEHTQAKIKEFKEKEAGQPQDDAGKGLKALITKTLVFVGFIVIIIVAWTLLPPKMHKQIAYAIDQVLKNFGFKKH